GRRKVQTMSKIEVNHITLAGVGSSDPPIPNVVRRTAESLILSLDVTELPAGTRKVKIVVTIFQPNGHPSVGGWFNSRIPYTEPLTTTFTVSSPQTLTVTIRHPDHVSTPPEWGLFRKAIGRIFLGTAFANLIRVLFSYFWHNGPGPYDTEVTLTAADQSGTTISGSE